MYEKTICLDQGECLGYFTRRIEGRCIVNKINTSSKRNESLNDSIDNRKIN